jgi:hypothetical protein
MVTLQAVCALMPKGIQKRIRNPMPKDDNLCKKDFFKAARVLFVTEWIL